MQNRDDLTHIGDLFNDRFLGHSVLASHLRFAYLAVQAQLPRVFICWIGLKGSQCQLILEYIQFYNEHSLIKTISS